MSTFVRNSTLTISALSVWLDAKITWDNAPHFMTTAHFADLCGLSAPTARIWLRRWVRWGVLIEVAWQGAGDTRVAVAWTQKRNVTAPLIDDAVAAREFAQVDDADYIARREYVFARACQRWAPVDDPCND
ncbi:MAG: hypothetical protein ACRCWJ_23730 [Casimicrobium sp.]